MALNVTRHSNLDAPDLRTAWERLSADSPRASLFSTREWCRCWAGSVGRQAEPAILLVKDEMKSRGLQPARPFERSHVVGLLPTCIEKVGPAKWLKFLGRERASGDHLDILCSPENHQDCLSAILAYIDRCDDFHGLILGELERDSPTLAMVKEWAEASSHPFLERERRVVPYIDLPPDLDAYLASLSSNMRYHIRRRRRGLERTAGASLRLLRDTDEVDLALADFFRLHEARWRRDGQSGLYQSQAMQRFLRDFCRKASQHGWARLYAIEHDGRRQCVLIAFHWGGVAYYYQIGWNPDGPIQSPGVIVMAESIAQAIREGIGRYDFLRGDEAYKTRWTSQAVKQTTLVVGMRGPARAATTAERLKDRFKKVIQRTFGEERWERVRQLVTDRPR